MVNRPSTVITKEDIQKAMPSRKNTITDEIVELLNASQNEAEFQGEGLLQTAATYEQLMLKNKSSMRQYLDAIRFCAYMISMNDNATEAYKKTFFYRDFVKERMDAPTDSDKYKELVASANRYKNNSALVRDIMTYSQLPLKLMYRGYGYEAMGVLHQIMHYGKLDRDRVAAAKTILEAVKDDETLKIELDIGVKENSAVMNLNEQLAQFAHQSLMHLQHGTTSLDKLGGMKAREDVIDVEMENE